MTLLIALGGAIGAVSRYTLSGWITVLLGESFFPYGTLAVNLVGCFLLGVVQQIGETTNQFSQFKRIAIAVGFLGALTTYSTFGYETLRQLESGRVLAPIGNVGAHLVFGLLAVWMGITLARIIWGGA
ncbi:MAG: fluoride efflux transporter CrcB [Proteobacteria bacterium]|nr:fluoride efflux transporter CrcB [Pseudomonadota bacterium]